MLFTIQAYLEDYLNKRNLVDSDGYAVRLANLYFHNRSSMDEDTFLKKVRQINTVIYVNNEVGDRVEFEKALVSRLDRKFKKKLGHNSVNTCNSGFDKEGLQKQIIYHTRRLQKLKEQQAVFGIHTPPYILIEIEDTEEDIKNLNTELNELS